MIGNTYANGALVVIGFDSENQVAYVRCRCNTVAGVKPYDLNRGRVKCCWKCEREQKYADSIKVDVRLLERLEIAQAGRVLRAFRDHLKSCEANKVPATAFVIFVKEMLADPDFENEEEAPLSFEARLIRSNHQHYAQYDAGSEYKDLTR